MLTEQHLIAHQKQDFQIRAFLRDRIEIWKKARSFYNAGMASMDRWDLMLPMCEWEWDNILCPYEIDPNGNWIEFYWEEETSDYTEKEDIRIPMKMFAASNEDAAKVAEELFVTERDALQKKVAAQEEQKKANELKYAKQELANLQARIKKLQS